MPTTTLSNSAPDPGLLPAVGADAPLPMPTLGRGGMDPALSRQIRCTTLVLSSLIVYVHARTLGHAPEPGPGYGPLFGAWANTLQEFFSNGLARMATPLFFCFSGFLFFSRYRPALPDLLGKYRKRTRTLLAPYLLWSLVGLLLIMGLQCLPFAEGFVRGSDHALAQKPWYDLLYIWALDPRNYQLWFLRELMILALVSPLLYWFVLRKPTLWLLGLSALWMCQYDPRLHLGPLPIISIHGLFWYNIGAFAAIHRLPIQRQVPWAGAAAVAWVTLNALRTWMAPDFRIEDETLAAFPLVVYKLAIIAGVLAVWTNYGRWLQWLERGPGLRLCGYTFFVYCLHEPLLTLSKRALLALCGSGTLQCLVIYLLLPLAIIATCMATGAIVKATSPRLYGVLSGGR